MPLRLIIVLLLLLSLGLLGAQNTLMLNGLNEAKFIYRTVPDSLNVYFYDSFSFGLGYKGFNFGMKFIAELPKYSNSQSELLQDITPDKLSARWDELYVSYTKDAYLLHAGIIDETFSNGIAFRSFKDIEFDTDNRVTGFKFGYDNRLRIKALYGAIASRNNYDHLDLAYGADAEYPFFNFLTLGGTGMEMRLSNAFGGWDKNDIYGLRGKVNIGIIEAFAEYYQRELLRPDTGLQPISGTALYGTLVVDLSPVQVGGTYKKYDQFQYRLQDVPVGNHHNETLADNQATGSDEEGFQAWANYALGDAWNFNLDYAEAWNAAKTRRMNDVYAAADWTLEKVFTTLSYSQVEKVDDALSHWQKEVYPALTCSFPAGGVNMVVNAEFKIVEKQSYDLATSHFEPKLQTDFSLGRLSLSLGVGSWWEDFSSIGESSSWANMEVKYPILEGTEIVLFGGKEPGGKVCRNGICRYVAPFSGLRLELNTRF